MMAIPSNQFTNTGLIRRHNVMDNHATTITPPIQMPTYISPDTIEHQTVEYWSTTNNIIGEVTIQPGKINTVICPETGKSQ